MTGRRPNKLGIFVGSGGETVEIYRDYMKIDGLWLPSKIDRDEGAMRVRYEVVTMKLNTRYDAAVFSRPENL